MKKREVIKWVSIGIGVIIVIAVFVFLFVDRFNLISSNIESKEWLMFWASYLGGTIGGVCTLIAVLITVRNAIKSQEEAQKNRDKEIAEDRKYQYAPFLVFKVVDPIEYSEEIVRFIYSPEENIDNVMALMQNLTVILRSRNVLHFQRIRQLYVSSSYM